MIRWWLLILLGLLCAPVAGFGQLTETDTMRFNLLASLNGNVSAGNIERNLFSAGVECIVSNRYRNWVFKTQNNYRYGTARGTRTENDLVLVNYGYHRPFKKVYPYFMTLYQNNLIRSINHRMGAGVGITVVALKRKSSLWKISATCFVDRTIYDLTLDESKRFSRVSNTLRPTLRIFESHQVAEHITFFYEFIDQLSVSVRGDHRVVGVAGIDVMLSRVVNFVSRLNYTHEDIVPHGTRQDDWYSTFGFNVQI